MRSQVETSYCLKCGTMVNFQQQWCDSCTPKLPRWMQGKRWSFNRYSNNPEDKRWCIQPTTSLRPLFFADVPEATTANQSHDIGRFIVSAVNNHALLVEALRDVRAMLPVTDENWGLTENEARMVKRIDAALATVAKESGR